MVEYWLTVHMNIMHGLHALYFGLIGLYLVLSVLLGAYCYVMGERTRLKSFSKANLEGLEELTAEPATLFGAVIIPTAMVIWGPVLLGFLIWLALTKLKNALA